MKTPCTLLLTLALGVFSSGAFAQPAGDAPKGRPPAGERPRQPRDGENRPPRDGEGRGQRQGMGQPLTAEKAKAAWEMEAKGVAARHKLSAEQTKALVKAYSDARASVQAKQEEARKNRGDGDRSEAARSIRDAETAAREQFNKALADAKISGDSLTKVNASLGAMGMVGAGWDRMVDTISGFHLDAAKQQDALNALEDYIVTTGKARESGRGGNGDQQDIRATMQDSREKMMTAMKSTLSAEQFAAFEKSFPGARGGEGRPDDAGRPRRDRANEDGETPRRPKDK